MPSSNTNVVGFLQQSRSTFKPKKSSIAESLGTRCSLSKGRDENGSYEVSRAASWLEKTFKKSTLSSSRGKVILEARYPETFNGLYSARFTVDGEQFVTGFGRGAIQMWNTLSSDHCTTIRNGLEHGFPIMCIRFLPNAYIDNFFAASACGILFLCGLKPGEYKPFTREVDNEINCVDVNLTSETAVTGGKDACLRLYDINTAKLKGKLQRKDRTRADSEMKFHKMRVFAVRFHPHDANIFLSGGWDDCVKMWDIRVNDGCVRDFKGPHICGDAIDIRSGVLVTGSWTVSNSLQTWDVSSGNLIDTITPINRPATIDGEFLYCAQFLDYDQIGNTVVIGGSGLGNVEIIDIFSKKVVGRFKVNKSVQAIDSRNKYMVYGGMESMFKVVSF